MNAIDMLEAQHRQVATLFEKIERARSPETKEKYFIQVADALAIHATIEEHHFYPAVRAKRTEDILLEALEEHLAIKRVLSDLLDVEVEDETFDAKLKVLQEEVEHHVEEEERDLFPKVKKLLDEGELDSIAAAMQAEQKELEEKGSPREAVPSETDKAAPLGH
jgi:hemerythrin superfamily protein